MEANYFTTLYWFCHTSTWIRHRYTRVPHPEPPSLLASPSSMHDTGCLGLVHWDYPRIEPTSLMSHALAGGFFATSVPPVPPGKPWAGLRVSETSNECCVARGKEALSLSLCFSLLREWNAYHGVGERKAKEQKTRPCSKELLGGRTN